LERDTKELVTLMDYLVCHHSAEQFALVGHSTGCQNSIHFLKYGRRDVVDRMKVCFFCFCLLLVLHAGTDVYRLIDL